MSTVIKRDPHILGGEPVFAGTRLSVRHVGKMLSRGTPINDVLADYPYLSKSDAEFAKLFYECERDYEAHKREQRKRS